MLAEPPVTITAEVVETLRAKFPQPPVDRPPAPAAHVNLDRPSDLTVSAEAVSSWMASFKRGTSAGLSGITAEHIMTGFRYAQKNGIDLAKELSATVQLLINGLAPATVAPWIVGGRLVPVGAKIRPIVVSDVLGRLTSKAAISVASPKLHEVFKGFQGGVGESNARERTIHLLDQDMRKHWDRHDWAVLSTDFRNGFNVASRAHIAEEITSHVPALFNWFQWSYGQPLELVLADGQRLQAHEGTCQGDPASPLWFALNMQPVLDNIMASFEGNLGVVRAYLDDDIFSGPIPVLLDVLHYLQSPDVRARGLDLRVDKCSLYVPNAGVIGADEIRADHRIPPQLAISTSGFIALGCPLGSDEFIAAELSKMAEQAKGYNVKLTELLGPQVALLLLRMCSGTTKVAHVLRCLAPDLTADMCAEVDASVRETLLRVMDVQQLSSTQWQQAELPLSQAGLGLTASSLVKEAAYLATVSTISARPELLQGCGPLQLDDRVTSAIQTYNALVTPSEKLDVATFLAGGKPLQQRDLTSAIHKKRFDTLLSDPALDGKDRSRIVEQTLVGASSWMTPTFEYNKSPISDEGFRLLLVRHLGGDFFDADTMHLRCPRSHIPLHSNRRPCNKVPDARLHHVTDLCKATFMQRHNTMAACISKLCRRAGISNMCEVACIPGCNNVPADVYVHEGPNGKPVALDVSIASPLVVSGSQLHPSPGSRLCEREASKIARYRKEFDSLNGAILFLPFAVSSFGGVGPRAKKFVSFIAAKLASSWYMTPQMARAYVMRQLMTSLMIHHATTLSQALASRLD